MYRVVIKENRIKRKDRMREKTLGTTQRPRLSIFRTNKYMYAQLIDDSLNKVVLSANSEVREVHKDVTKTEAAIKLGEVIAKKALKAGINAVTFDRNGFKYHGRVAGVAEGARKGGLTL